MADRLRVTELDFDTIKTNLKAFLQQQNEFTDYDFDGSGLSVLLDILAYNTHYNAYYLNMVANEAFLDTALLRDSVVSHAKALGYTPHSKTASKSVVNFTVTAGNSTSAQLTVPRGFSFLSNQIDGKSYNFVTLEDTTVTKTANSTFIFENLNIHEGQLVTYNYTHTEISNPKSIFIIDDANVDTSSLKVTVRPSPVSTEFTIYTKVTDISQVNSTSSVYFLQEGKGGKYEIYFGNDVVGKKIPDGGVVTISYLVTNSSDANGAENFKATQTLTDTLSTVHTNFSINVISVSSGGGDRQQVDSIKILAPAQYSSQNRLVTKNDYSSYLSSVYTQADSISIWGGEEQIPKVYGKIFVAIKPKDGFFLSQTEKQRIIEEILIPKSVIGTQIEILDPNFIYLKTQTKILYDKTKTTKTENVLRQQIQASIILYKNENIDEFKSTFVTSKLQKAIDSVDTSIIGSETLIRLEKRIEPTLQVTTNYILNFNIPLYRGTILDSLRTNEFYYNDGTISRICQIEEGPQSFTGVEKINIINPGFGYITNPTVTITGDGSGATAEAKIVNGKVNSITVTNRGVNYTKAIVTISGGDGSTASATAVVSGEVGTLRLFYYDSNSEKQIINNNIGSINYTTGTIQINDLKIQSIVSGIYLKVDIQPKSSIVETEKNTIITIDENDPSSIITTFEKM